MESVRIGKIKNNPVWEVEQSIRMDHTNNRRWSEETHQISSTTSRFFIRILQTCDIEYLGDFSADKAVCHERRISDKVNGIFYSIVK